MCMERERRARAQAVKPVNEKRARMKCRVLDHPLTQAPLECPFVGPCPAPTLFASPLADHRARHQEASAGVLPLRAAVFPGGARSRRLPPHLCRILDFVPTHLATHNLQMLPMPLRRRYAETRQIGSPSKGTQGHEVRMWRHDVWQNAKRSFPHHVHATVLSSFHVWQT